MKHDEATAYPLAWPDGWPRTPASEVKSSRVFRTAAGLVTFDRARRLLAEELERLNVTDVVLSTNVPLRIDGNPYASAADRRMDDAGVAVYFRLRDRPMVMAQDAFDGVAGNMRSLGLAIEAMRTLERHGGGHMMERAFSGFAAIEKPGPKPWRRIFRVPADWTPGSKAELMAKFRELAKVKHPDVGGHDLLMADLNVAHEDARREFGFA